ncbi:P2 family phage major capsid protein [Pseudomonas sp. HK3]
MSPDAIKALSNAHKQIAKGFEATSDQLIKGYSVSASVTQKLNESIRADNDFLKKINVIGVKEVKAEKIMVGTKGPVSRRTNTSNGNERKARSAHKLTSRNYELHKTETDIAIRHETLESWVHIDGGLATMIRNQVKQQIGEDRVVCGWNGVSAAADTDPENDPLLTNLNIGWLEKARVENSDAHFVEGVKDSGKITIGKGGDYANLSAAVSALKKAIPKHKRKNLVAFIGEDLADEYEQQIWSMYGEQPTEEDKLAANKLLGRVAKLPMETPEGFPDGTIFICSHKNLSIYWQKESWKTTSGDNHKADQYEDLNKRNEGYVLEDEEACALAENLEYLPAE